MIKKIKFMQYRKFKDIEVNFVEGVNVISGINGTCKTSLLHIVTNSFQKIKKEKFGYFGDFSKLNIMVNPKIETLAKQANNYNNPAYGVKGVLYTVEYSDGLTLFFRRKNDIYTNNTNRFRIIPKYSSDKKEKLPHVPVIYLGLTRLIPFQQIENNSFKKCTVNVPNEVMEDTISIYNDLFEEYIYMDKNDFIDFHNMKKRINFKTNNDQIDSNTISDGQDNIYTIATALASLKYVFVHKCSLESILLIDELDATLHPDLQIRLLEIIYNYSIDYKIQVFVTTHSLDIIEKALKSIKRGKSYSVKYITNSGCEKLSIFDDDLSIDLVRSKLYCINMSDLNEDKIIVISEDAEAQLFLNELLDFFCKEDKNFEAIKNKFYIAETKIGCGNIISMFSSDQNKINFLWKQIGVVDGDCKDNRVTINNNLIKLPGDDSPENLFFNYCKFKSADKNTDFFDGNAVNNNVGVYDYDFYNIHLKSKILDCLDYNDSDKREKNKNLFNSHLDFFNYVIKYWINDKNNYEVINKFKNDIINIFKKIESNRYKVGGINLKYQ